MPDREKVIRAVDSCFDYWLDQHRYLRQLELETVRQRKAEAIALLKEQEAVKPYVTGRGESFETAETWWYECGNCNKPIDPNDKFCRHCGMSVKWE